MRARAINDWTKSESKLVTLQITSSWQKIAVTELRCRVIHHSFHNGSIKKYNRLTPTAVRTYTIVIRYAVLRFSLIIVSHTILLIFFSCGIIIATFLVSNTFA